MPHTVEVPEAARGHAIIRASDTNSWPDCNRRTFARAFPELVISAGHKLRDRIAHIGAVVGTGAHVAAQWTHDRPDEKSAAVDAGIASMYVEAEAGVMYDSLTGNLDHAKTQLQRITAVYQHRVYPELREAVVEGRLWAEVGPRVSVTGQPDGALDDETTDLKTGARAWSHVFQLGTYSLLRRTNGAKPTRLREIRIPRTRISAGQQDPVMTYYPVDAAEQGAWQVIDDMKGALNGFLRHREIDKIPANPGSVLCSSAFCPLHSTAGCRLWQGAE